MGIERQLRWIRIAAPCPCSCECGFNAGTFAFDVIALELCGWMLGGEIGVFVLELLMAALFAFDFFAFEALFAQLVLLAGGVCAGACPVGISSQRHFDAIHGAGRYAQFATSASVCKDGVHEFGGADDGIDWAGLDAFGAADAFVFDDGGDAQGLLHAVVGVERYDGATGDLCQLGNALCATRWALVDRGVFKGNGVRIGGAAVVAALGALGLRQGVVDALGELFCRCVELRGRGCV